DERLMRLALPICVATLVRVDFYANRLWFAHGGDTAMYLFREDGAVEQVTDDRVAHEHENQALYAARTTQQEQQAERLIDVVSHPDVQRAIRKSGLYHNYVDSHGQINRELGYGVVDGLPELDFYLQRGEISLEGIDALLICSDGFIWHERWGESESEAEQRLLMMRQRIESDGLSGYVAALRSMEEEDNACNLYPRFKVHDDVTAVYLEL
ncbi:MAG: protein phosphatase 2C domain-containing protein, partial [Anaerolineae bacterium]|nr:protein phosphatase 2C domain-containing protein [Anaerolineae bacterium]